MNKNEAVESFLKRHMMHCDEIDINVHVQSFISHMTNGLEGTLSSLAMLPTYLEIHEDWPRNEKVIVMDAGGTNLRTALIHFDNNMEPVLEHFKKFPIPGSHGEVSREEFFDMLVDAIKDLVSESTKIGFCFSYPTHTMPNHDGKLLFFSKGIKVKNHENMLIGAGLREALHKKGYHKDFKIAVVNDTVTTLLMGMLTKAQHKFDGYIGVVLGTGMNAAYQEKNIAITKVTHSKKVGPRQIVNVESGNFSGYLQGSIDRSFNDIAAPIGMHSFEKTMSGAYLGPLTSHVLQSMCGKDIFSKPFSTKLSAITSKITTKDLSAFLKDPLDEEQLMGKIAVEIINENPAEGPSDVEALYLACELLVERAAKLFAISIASVILKSEQGLSPLKPLCIVIDGTTFYSIKGLSLQTHLYLHQILQGNQRRYFEIVRVENASLLGAAVAALTTFRDN